MNILPLVLILVLMISVLTVEKLERFKNQFALKKQYLVFLEENERQVFNKRQQRLFGISQKSLKQLSFRSLLDEEMRENDPNITKQHRFLLIELMKILYGEAAFYKNLQSHRPHFLEELLNAIQKAADKAPEKSIKRIQDIARLDLEDPELQQAFYHMLKGTIEREKLTAMKETLSANAKEKAYVSLFHFINYDGKTKAKKIILQRAPREILKAIFEKDEIVEAIIERRNELKSSKDNGAQSTFESEFKGKIRPGLDDQLFSFEISSSDKTEYN